MGIYKITNPNGKIYIGSSIRIEKRWISYNSLNKKQPKLFYSFQKYGKNNHIFEIIEECSKENLYKRENYWGKYFNVLEEGLNCFLPGYENIKSEVSKDTKLKLSISQKGLKNSMYGKSGVLSPVFGRKCSNEQKEKLSKIHKNKIISLEHKKKISKKVICTETLHEYHSISEFAKSLNKKYSTVVGFLNGLYKNPTTYVLYENFKNKK